MGRKSEQDKQVEKNAGVGIERECGGGRRGKDARDRDRQTEKQRVQNVLIV